MISEITRIDQSPIFSSNQFEGSLDPMEDQLCRVCEEKAAGFHFGAFTCEGCKSFFGRFCNNQTNIPDCKNNYECVIDKRNRTACKACRLRKCLAVGMSKSGCRYGRRSNWFKIHCLMQKKSAQNSLSTKMSQQSAQSSAGVLPRVSPTLSSASSFMNPRHPSSRSPSPLNTSSESSGPSPVPQASSPLIPFLPFLPSPHNNPFQSTPFQANNSSPFHAATPSPFPVFDPMALYRLSPLMALSPLFQNVQKTSDFHDQLRLLAERRALFEASCANQTIDAECKPIDADCQPIDLSVK